MSAQLSPEVRKLLQAIHDALEVPLAAVGGESRELSLWEHRGSSVRSVLLAFCLGENPVRDPAFVAEYLAEETAELPVEYDHYVRTLVGSGGGA